jgi:hypothetical protein
MPLPCLQITAAKADDSHTSTAAKTSLYAQPFSRQLVECTRKLSTAYWRMPAYNFTRLWLTVGCGILYFLMYLGVSGAVQNGAPSVFLRASWCSWWLLCAIVACDTCRAAEVGFPCTLVEPRWWWQRQQGRATAAAEATQLPQCATWLIPQPPSCLHPLCRPAPSRTTLPPSQTCRTSWVCCTAPPPAWVGGLVRAGVGVRLSLNEA